MKKMFNYLLILALTLSAGIINAQTDSINTDSTKVDSTKIDSTKIDEDDGFGYKFDFGTKDFKDFNLFRFLSKNDNEEPFMGLNFGLGQGSIHKDYFPDKFTDNKLLEAKIGYSETNLSASKKILYFEDDYLGFKYSSNKLFDDKKVSNDIDSKRWVISWGDSKGYGWVLGSDVDLILYNGDMLNWTRIDFSDSTSSKDYQHRLDRFSDNLRFGQSFEAGMRLRLFQNVCINVAYEQEHIFARYQIWYWAGSEIIEAAVTGLTSNFIDRVIHRSSVGGPIANFIIKNAISYAFYELRKKDMNWPFKTEAPMVFNNFKVGLSFTF